MVLSGCSLPVEYILLFYSCMTKKGNANQLSLLEQFEKSKNRQELLVKQLIHFIGLVKYYRTCTSFADIPPPVKTDRLAILENILYWVAQLAFKQSKGLPGYSSPEASTFAYFHRMTKDGVFLNMVEPPDPKALEEYYVNGSKRIRTLLILNRDLMKHDIDLGSRIVDNFNDLIKTQYAI